MNERFDRLMDAKTGVVECALSDMEKLIEEADIKHDLELENANKD